MVFIRLPRGHVCEAVFLIANCWRKAQATVGSAVPRQVG